MHGNWKIKKATWFGYWLVNDMIGNGKFDRDAIYPNYEMYYNQSDFINLTERPNRTLKWKKGWMRYWII